MTFRGTSAHGLIQTARGALTDEDWREAERLLAKAVDAIKDIEEERDQLRERVASLMLDEPSKTAGLYAAIDELQARVSGDET